MAKGRYIYTTDNNRSYIVRLDTAIGDNDMFGFDRVTNESDLDYLPRGMRMRRIGCSKLQTTFDQTISYRFFPIGKKSARILGSAATQFRYKDVTFVIRRFTPEVKRR
ncbi:hypothetical protein BCD67_24715 [Oscillatoriales cyanobacterium USR001]|nr:hypothetical protein BCD67_24715 [Oscillatoriales cyanobacterium USR001]